MSKLLQIVELIKNGMARIDIWFEETGFTKDGYEKGTQRQMHIQNIKDVSNLA